LGRTDVRSGKRGVLVVTLLAGAASVLWLSTASAGSPLSSLRSTSTSVSCYPATQVVGGTSTCTAVVSDTDTGTATTPSGTVDFSASNSVLFPDTAACTLSAGTCQITYIGFQPLGAATMTASYSGDSDYAPSSGTAVIYVIAPIGPGPLPPFHFATNRARPIAGKRFTGITVTYISTPITKVQCHGSIGGKRLVARQRRFYERGIPGPAAVSCGWQIPKASAGKLLYAWARGFTPSGDWRSPQSTWRVKP
jgi:Big-like domain-containing protein